MNYKKYKNLLLSDIFFDSYNFPVALVDTKKFSYKNENEFSLEKNETQTTLSEIKKRQNEVKTEIQEIHSNATLKIKNLESEAHKKLNEQISKIL